MPYSVTRTHWLGCDQLKINDKFMKMSFASSRQTIRLSTQHAFINSVSPSDAIGHHRTLSILVQVMACCLMAPSHYLNWCWLTISEVLLCLYECNFAGDISPWYEFENDKFKITAAFCRGWWIDWYINMHTVAWTCGKRLTYVLYPFSCCDISKYSHEDDLSQWVRPQSHTQCDVATEYWAAALYDMYIVFWQWQ